MMDNMAETKRSAPARNERRPGVIAAAVIGAIAVMVTLVVIHFSDRRVVSRSLSTLRFYEYVEVPGGLQTVYSPHGITNSFSYRAILGLGREAVPALMQALEGEAEWRESTERWQAYRDWIQRQWRTRTRMAVPKPRTYPDWQRSRNFAAGVMLLVLGTNNGAGFPPLMEVCAAIRERDAGRSITGPKGGFTPSEVVRIACSLAPGRRDEIVTGVLAGLQHSNVYCRGVAANASRALADEIEIFAPILVQRVNDTNEVVQLEALFAFAGARWPTNVESKLPPRDVFLAETVESILSNTNSSKRVREAAEAVRPAKREGVRTTNAH